MSMINNDWLSVLAPEFKKPYYAKLYQFVKEEYHTHVVYPPSEDIFNAFHFTPLKEVKVLILGQDPYHDVGQAHGLCFSVQEGVAQPPSLQNIFKEIHSETGAPIPASGDLTRWARQGVLLLNSLLTVRAHQPGSHQGKGWEQFTDAVIAALNREREHLVFLLWGSYAIRKGSLVDSSRHLVLTSPHPSPLSSYRGFFGNHHFTLCNDYLIQHGQQPILW